ncbi:hypothetical protein ABK040_012030 [Willaertia magna]
MPRSKIIGNRKKTHQFKEKQSGPYENMDWGSNQTQFRHEAQKQIPGRSNRDNQMFLQNELIKSTPIKSKLDVVKDIHKRALALGVDPDKLKGGHMIEPSITPSKNRLSIK